MSKLLRLAAGALVAAALSTGSTLAQDAEPSADIDPNAEPPRCVWLRNINGYSVIDREHLVLNGGASRHYLATLRNPCPDLRFGAQIGTSFGRSERICRPVVEYITVDDGWRCPIDQIEEVDSLKAARALVEARAQASEDGAESQRR